MSDQQPKRGKGRPKGSTNKKKAPTANGHVDTDHNETKASGDHRNPEVAKNPLTEDQQRALFFRHKEEYEKALAAKKAADADHKVVCKRIKAEGNRVADIKLAIELDNPEGSTEMRDRLQRELQVARWMGASVGTQFSFFDEVDRTPIDERVFEEGKRAGLKGDKCEAPRHLPGNLITNWVEGWTVGQQVLASKIKQQRTEDGKAFDDEIPGGEATA